MDQENIFTPHSPLSGLVVLKDSLDADGNFLVSYTLRHALQEGYKVQYATVQTPTWVALLPLEKRTSMLSRGLTVSRGCHPDT